MDDLQKYMLNDTLIKQSSIGGSVHESVRESVSKSVRESVRESKKSVTKPAEFQYPSFFYPEQADQLFWCFYIIKNGFLLYEYPGTTSFINEKKEKFKYIEFLRENVAILKEKKIKNIKEDIEDDLANKEKISVKTFIALCIAHNIRVLFINNRKCFDSDKDNTGKIHVVHYDNNKKYCYEHNVSADKLIEYQSTYYPWDNIDKPLRAISYYTVADLLQMHKQALLSSEEKIKRSKKELYEDLVKFFS